MTTLLIDNYDSFTWNVYQSLSNLGANVKVIRNDKITLEEAIALNPRNLVISPGPGYPSTAGISITLIKHFQGSIPILGVCLGEQAIYELYGGTVGPCGEIIHGKSTPVNHDGLGIFEGVAQGIECIRYHSLAGELKTLPKDLIVSAWIDSGIIMGIRHKVFVIEGVQFHPESIASEQGDNIFSNFLSMSGGEWSKMTKNSDLVRDSIRYTKLSTQKAGDGIPLSLASKMNSTSKFIPTTFSNESILSKIHSKRMEDVAWEKCQNAGSMAYLERSYALGLAPQLISFRARMQQSIDQSGVAILAEIKRASPSKGDIDISAHAAQQALLYAEGGAAVISVLTEPNWFKGSIKDLIDVRNILDPLPNRPAVLRKEFIFDRYQILQARLAGADCVLLIVAMLTEKVLKDLFEYSKVLGMESLVEVANSSEMQVALRIGASVIGVNNRDLNTFKVDMNRTNILSTMVDDSIILLALSGISCYADVASYLKSGARGVLVGEALMKAGSKQDKIRELMGLPPASSISFERNNTMVKICGLTNVDDAVFAAKAGADFLGFIFAKESPRYVDARNFKVISKEIRNIFPSVSVRTAYDLNVRLDSTSGYLSNVELSSRKPLLVGVFTHHSADEINQISRECDLDMIQCHTPCDSSFHRLLNRPVIQVIGIQDNVDVVSKIGDVASSCSAILLDTVTSKASGGTGLKFDWEIVRNLVRNQIPVWMAGGLDADNVEEAVGLKPRVVDVCSGVELSKGKKNHGAIIEFINNAKGKVCFNENDKL